MAHRESFLGLFTAAHALSLLKPNPPDEMQGYDVQGFRGEPRVVYPFRRRSVNRWLLFV
jgi:hypothetical protein